MTHFDLHVLCYLTFFCCFLSHSQRIKRNMSWRGLPPSLVFLHLWQCARLNTPDVFLSFPVWDQRDAHPLLFPAVPPTTQPHQPLSICLQQLCGWRWSRPAMHMARVCNQSETGSRQMSQAIDSSAGVCRFWQGAPGQLVQRKHLCWRLDPLSR